MKLFTSAYLEGLDIDEFESVTEHCLFRYQLTEGELGWLLWISKRYDIAGVLWDTMESDDDGTTTVLIDTMQVAEALAGDGVDRPPGLSEDTQLCRLIWYIGPDEGE